MTQKGDRVELVSCSDPYTRLMPGEKGTVTRINRSSFGTTVFVDWEERVLVVQGSGFNWPHPDHIRVVFLPHEEDLTEAIGRMSRLLDRNRAHR